ncbi:hypothetical protein IKR55_03660 [bacterium]|nr:hypothetical protein [bacterium]
MGGDNVNTNYYREESWVGSTFTKRGKWVLSLIASVLVVGMIAGGCGVLQNIGMNNQPAPEPAPTEVVDIDATPTEGVNVPADTDLDVSPSASSMVSYDVSSVGRADPFMPYGEIQAYDDAVNSALAEANAHNAKIAELQRLKNMAVREPDDISPYKFNLPVPPTSLAPEGAAAAVISRTKVVGIMYNASSPSAIINVDDKDYLVRIGDNIIGQEYKVLKINPSWITVGLGSNIYSASIGELFVKDELNSSSNDLYNMKNRFGGRKG